MKKIITLVLVIGLVVPLVTGAQGNQGRLASKIPGERTFVGVIDSINANEKSFVLRIGESVSLFQRFVAALFPSRGYIAPKYQVVTSENTLFQKKTTTGVAEANFDDLVVSQRVQVKGIYEGLSITNSQNNILGRITANYVFILTLSSSTSTLTSPTISLTTTTTIETTELKCIPVCLKGRGWVWSCPDPVTGVWKIRTGNLIKIDKSCNGCKAECLYQGTPKEGYYSSCDNNLIISGCKRSFEKPSSTSTLTSPTISLTTTTTIETTELKCIPVCLKGRGWVWSCPDPVTGVWKIRTGNLIKIDKSCNGCKAECLYQGTPKEGYYSSCNNSLIVSGCKSPIGK